MTAIDGGFLSNSFSGCELTKIRYDFMLFSHGLLVQELQLEKLNHELTFTLNMP